MKPSVSLAVLFAGRRSALAAALLLFSAVFLVSASTARADQLTYNIIPFSYVDNINPGDTDTFTGTITVSAAGGIFNTYTAGDDSTNSAITLTWDLIMTSDDPTVSQVSAGYYATLDTVLQGGSVTFSAAGIDLATTADLNLDTTSSVPYSAYVLSHWGPVDVIFNVAANPGGGFNGGIQTMQIHDTSTSANYVNGLWTIAVVPEPATLTLLALGGLTSLGAMWIRRRRTVTE